ncbi:MAG: ferritin-like domain-containing protein [Chitinophagaceae bacterium]|nr:ferritin-like domain-containing protein [Chitinophagaceae bacterium]
MKKDTNTRSTRTIDSLRDMNGKNKQQPENRPVLLEKLFYDLLKDMYWAEKHLVQTLPDLQKAATTTELEEAFEDHLLQTQKHVLRLERIFKLLGCEAQTKKCEAMSGLTEEAKSLIKETKDGTMTRDAALIIAAQKVEHYEIATYGSLVQLARTLDEDEVASILEETLWEEEDTDQHLTHIAETYVNPMSDQEGDGSETINREKDEVQLPEFDHAEQG